MDDISEETRTKIGLTGAQAAYIENARVGNVNDHSEILVSAGICCSLITTQVGNHAGR